MANVSFARAVALASELVSELASLREHSTEMAARLEGAERDVHFLLSLEGRLERGIGRPAWLVEAAGFEPAPSAENVEQAAASEPGRESTACACGHTAARASGRDGAHGVLFRVRGVGWYDG